MDVINGVLRHDSAAAQLQSCIAVPKELQQNLISKGHASPYQSGKYMIDYVIDSGGKECGLMSGDFVEDVSTVSLAEGQGKQCTPHCSQYHSTELLLCCSCPLLQVEVSICDRIWETLHMGSACDSRNARF